MSLGIKTDSDIAVSQKKVRGGEGPTLDKISIWRASLAAREEN